MYELVRTNIHGVKFFRNIDTGEEYANTYDVWWIDIDGSGNFFGQATAPEACRILSN